VFLYNLPNSCIALLFGITGAALFAGVLFLRGLSLREYANSIVNDEWPQLSKSRVSGRTTRLGGALALGCQGFAVTLLVALVFVFDRPFRGRTSVSPQPIMKVIAEMQIR